MSQELQLYKPRIPLYKPRAPAPRALDYWHTTKTP